jgi:DNA invertase Pin-like site-specific DNA recombinase|tara:strand:- start:2619 stop:3278 length:660 start_codon:yes stop_codon:yes gene_type:complete
MTLFISYQRVSTREQGKSGLGLDAQMDVISRFIAGAGGDLVEAFIDVQSGADESRPQLQAAIAFAQANQVAIIVSKQDRLTRDAGHWFAMQKLGIEIVCCDNPTGAELLSGVNAVLGQHERRLISERTKAALAAKKARGEHLGSRDIRKVAAASAAVRSRQAQERAEIIYPIIEHLRQLGITTLRGIARELEQRKNCETARGGRWTATQVSQVIARCEA